MNVDVLVNKCDRINLVLMVSFKISDHSQCGLLNKVNVNVNKCKKMISFKMYGE